MPEDNSIQRFIDNQLHSEEWILLSKPRPIIVPPCAEEAARQLIIKEVQK